jgi:protein TonB
MPPVRRQLPRWGVSLLIVLALHGILAFWALFWRAQATPVAIPPPAMIVQLEPLPTPAPQPAPPPPPPPAEEPEPLPKLAEAPKPTLAVTQPKPKPKPRPPTPPKPKPEVKPQEPQKPAEEAPPAPPAPPRPTPSAPAAPQQSVSSVPSQVKETWQSKLLSHLAKFKKYPLDARRRGIEGINRLRFAIDAQGNVLSYELEGASGSASLDRATLDMIRRAQPLPPPPPELLDGGRIEVVAPFVYSLERRG